MRLFDPFALAALDPRRPLVRFDVPGIGASPAPHLPYRFATLAATLRGVVSQLGYPQADILGISWGGGLAQQYALQYPRHCRRLVLVATTTGTIMIPAPPRRLVLVATTTGTIMIPAPPRRLALMMTPRRHRDPAFARAIAGTLYGGTARSDGARVVAALHDPPGAPSTRGYLYQLLAISGWTSAPVLPLIRQPTLVLAGDDDPLIPDANAVLLAALLPHSRLHRYHGGHLALLTEPDELAPTVDAFLDSPRPSSDPGAIP